MLWSQTNNLSCNDKQMVEMSTASVWMKNHNGRKRGIPGYHNPDDYAESPSNGI